MFNKNATVDWTKKKERLKNRADDEFVRKNLFVPCRSWAGRQPGSQAARRAGGGFLHPGKSIFLVIFDDDDDDEARVQSFTLRSI